MVFLKKIFFMLAIILVAVNTNSAYADVTVPTDPIVRVDGTNDGDGDSGGPPLEEGVLHAIDDDTQKYLNFLDLGSGFIVTPSMGSTIVTGLVLYTANDEEPRDPASYLLEGSNNGVGGPFTLISQGSLSLPVGRNASGIPIPPETLLPGNPSLNHQVISFANNLPYTSYQLTFPSIKDNVTANSMQIGEVEFLGEAYSPPASIPTINEWGMIVLALLLGIVAFLHMHKKGYEGSMA